MKNIDFVKYHGNGNDFILIDCRDFDIYKKLLINKEFSIKDICDRNFGIGADGIIFILKPDQDNDAKMVIYNSDNSEAEMCGNGIRCLVQYLHKTKQNNEYKIETKAGTKIANYNSGEISVKMGKPIFEAKLVPTNIENYICGMPSTKFIFKDFSSQGYILSMGNPHLIFFVDDLSLISLSEMGPSFENNSLFPEKTNVHFCKIVDVDKIKVLVWERGAGKTLACGTGACAIHVAANKLGLCNCNTKINLPGGLLNIFWNSESEEVIMSGYAKEVFTGTYTLIK